MKITIGPISLDLLLYLRLWWPASVFIVVCTSIFVAFITLLGMITLTINSSLFVGAAWLSLLILYIILGVVFTRFSARLIRRSFESEAWRIQKRMVILSGVPFYALSLLFVAEIVNILFNPALQAVEMIGAAFFISFAGALLLALTSWMYVALTLSFLRRSTAIAH